MSTGRMLYWLLTGAVIGFGVIAILSIGLPFVILGLLLVAFGAVRLGIREIWAAVVGLGGLPAAILLWDVTSGPWLCETQGGGSTSLPNVSYYTCVDTPVGLLTTYQVLAFWFGVVALLGLAWPLLSLVVRRLRRAEG